MCVYTHTHVCTYVHILTLISESSDDDSDDPDWEPQHFSTPPAEQTNTVYGPAPTSTVALINRHTGVQL